MKKLIFTFVIFLFMCSTATFAQDKLIVKDKDGNVLMQVNDEGPAGSITLPPVMGLRLPGNKLYNLGGKLFFNGFELGGVSLWAKTRGGIFFDGGNVGIGISPPTVKLHVIGKIKSGGPNNRSITIDGTDGVDDKIIGSANLEFYVGEFQRAFRLENRNISPNVIGGFGGNTTSFLKTSDTVEERKGFVAGATIGGGGARGARNAVFSNFGTIGGGRKNTIRGKRSTIGGGRRNLAVGREGVIGGGSSNFVRAFYATVGGGQNNVADAIGATVGGGGGGCVLKDCVDEKLGLNNLGNIATGRYSTVAGGEGNVAGSLRRKKLIDEIEEDEQNEYVGGNLRKGEGDYTTVSGGYVNIARSSFASVGGGLHNRALGRNSTIGGGAGNRAKGFYATVSGGQHNIARAIGATVAGGGGMCMIGCNDGNVDIKNIGNIASGRYTTVSGGAGNIAGAFGRTHIINELTDSELDENGQAYLKKHIGDYATVSGGHDNAARSSYTTVGGGFYNMAGMDYLKVINGDDAYNGNYATVSGGNSNTASGSYATVGGGQNNTAQSIGATVAGGGGCEDCNEIPDVNIGNRAISNYATVSGGSGNSAGSDNGTPGPGQGDYATVSGGHDNAARSSYTTVGGGLYNMAGMDDLKVIKGDDEYNGNYATVSGGNSNTASGSYATVGGGQNNTAQSTGATVAGGGGAGFGNKAFSRFTTVSGGEDNVAGVENIAPAGFGDNDYATVGGGRINRATGLASTVGGGSSNIASGNFATIPGGSNNEASDFFSFAAGRRAKATSYGSFVWGDGKDHDIKSGQNPNTFTARATGGVRFISEINPTDGSVVAGVRLRPGSNSWEPIAKISDRNLKEHFKPVHGTQILENLKGISIQTWNYKFEDSSIRHIGPMAQDFYAAFNVGKDDKHIDMIDASGVALAAIQELYQMLQEKDEEIKFANAELQAMKNKMAEFEELKIKMVQFQSQLQQLADKSVQKVSNVTGSE